MLSSSWDMPSHGLCPPIPWAPSCWCYKGWNLPPVGFIESTHSNAAFGSWVPSNNSLRLLNLTSVTNSLYPLLCSLHSMLYVHRAPPGPSWARCKSCSFPGPQDSSSAKRVCWPLRCSPAVSSFLWGSPLASETTLSPFPCKHLWITSASRFILPLTVWPLLAWRRPLFYWCQLYSQWLQRANLGFIIFHIKRRENLLKIKAVKSKENNST